MITSITDFAENNQRLSHTHCLLASAVDLNKATRYVDYIC